MEDCKDFDSIFSNLLKRKNKENDLSDFTYAMMMTSDEFKKLFIDFCFCEPASTLGGSIKNELIVREFSLCDSRPDFYFIDSNGQDYVIEVKIDNKQQHFEQYEKDFPRAKYAFIANYDYTNDDVKNNGGDEKLWNLKTWNGFKAKIENEKDFGSDTYKKMVKYYLQYIDEICHLNDKQSIDFSSVKQSVECYMDNLKNKITDLEGIKPKHEGNTYGYYIEKNIEDSKTVNLWLGAWFNDDKEYSIFIEVQKEKDNEIFKKCMGELCKKSTDSTHYEISALENEGLWLELKDEYKEKLKDKTKPDDCKQSILQKFFGEVISVIQNTTNSQEDKK